MREILRFKDLRERGIMSNWPTLAVAVANEGFPPGFRLHSGRVRAWFADDVEKWLEARPSALDVKENLKGGAKRRAAGEYVAPRRKEPANAEV